MSRVIAVANQKGGVGKTTTTVNLSAALASMRKRVLLIDLDPQGNATMGCGIEKHEVETGIYDVLVDGMPVVQARHAERENGCDVLAANSDLTAAEVELMNMDEREQRLHQALVAVRDSYDFILIDCPPSLNILTLNAFVAADSVLVPIQCEYYALEGLSALLETIEGVREAVNADIAIEGLLRTMYDGRNKLGVEVSAQLVEHFGDQVFRTVVPRNVRLAEAPSHGLSIMEYDQTSRGALAYQALAYEVVRNSQQAGSTGSPSPALETTEADHQAQPGEQQMSQDTSGQPAEPEASAEHQDPPAINSPQMPSSEPADQADQPSPSEAVQSTDNPVSDSESVNG